MQSILLPVITLLEQVNLYVQAAALGDIDLIRVLGKHKIPFRTSNRANQTPWEIATELKVVFHTLSGSCLMMAAPARFSALELLLLLLLLLLQ